MKLNPQYGAIFLIIKCGLSHVPSGVGRHQRTPSLPGPISPSSTMTASTAATMAQALDPRALMLAVPPQPPSALQPAAGPTEYRRQISADGSSGGGYSKVAPEPPTATSAVDPLSDIDPLQWLFQELINLLLVLSQADCVVKGFVCTKDNLQQLLECLGKLQQPHLVKVGMGALDFFTVWADPPTSCSLAADESSALLDQRIRSGASHQGCRCHTLSSPFPHKGEGWGKRCAGSAFRQRSAARGTACLVQHLQPKQTGRVS